jgi:hypothetical protein
MGSLYRLFTDFAFCLETKILSVSLSTPQSLLFQLTVNIYRNMSTDAIKCMCLIGDCQIKTSLPNFTIYGVIKTVRTNCWGRAVISYGLFNLLKHCPESFSVTLAQTFSSVVKKHENYGEGNSVDEYSISDNKLEASVLCYIYIRMGLYEFSHKRKLFLKLMTASMFLHFVKLILNPLFCLL